MTKNEANAGAGQISLGQHLAAIRGDRKLSLRQVEEATNKEVSNAYLSQLENDKIKQPSPHILHALAELYAADYTVLMQKAGYLKESVSRANSERHGRLVTFAEMNLTHEEEAELLRFLKFRRAEKQSGSAAR
jgi:HTH-type transcriptional regulator, competence development regulator